MTELNIVSVVWSKMAMFLISWRITYFMKATFPGYKTQQGHSDNKIQLSSKLHNAIPSFCISHGYVHIVCDFFPCSEKFFELDPTSLHTNVNRKKTPRKLTVKPFSYSPTLHSLSYLHSITSHTHISILHLNNPQLSL